MGSWGYSALECDEGQEVKERWDDWVSSHNAVGYDEAIKRFFSQWGDAIRYGDSITNNKIIALTYIHLDQNISIPKKLRKVAEDAINRELVESELARWNDSDKRSEFLIQVLQKIGGVEKKPKSPNVFLDQALHYRSLEETEKKLSKSYNKLKNSKYPIGISGAGFPEFMITLERFMNHRVWEKDSKIFMQARAERAMMLATYLAIQLNLSQEELDSSLQEICKKLKVT